MTLKEKLNSYSRNGITLAVLSCLSVLAPVLMYAYRFGWVFVDIVLFQGFCMTVFWLMIFNAILGLFLDACILYPVQTKGERWSKAKWFFPLLIAHIVLDFLFTVVWIVFLAVSGAESVSVGGRFLSEILPFVVMTYGGMVLLFFFPKIKEGKMKIILTAVLTLLLFFGIVFSVFPGYVYKINSHPMIIDNGEAYSVVFSTNDYGTGYVEYTYQGQKYKVYDENNGRLNGDSCIHTVTVPYEHLENNAYRVGSQRVIDELSYGGRLGKEQVSQEYSFSSPKGKDTQEYLMISDWHTYLKSAKKAVSYAGDYSGVIMLGDPAPGLNFEEEVITNIIQFGGELTKGRMPVVYVRGNHETRGKYASKLADALGMERYYYTLDTGDYTFLVLDSGEDKKDDHPEYGGMDNYEQYRKSMVEWLENVEIDANDKVITVVHSKNIAIEKDLRDRAYRRLEELGVKYVFSGHTHACRLAESLGENIITYEDGGHNGNRYVASKITIHSDSDTVDIQAWDDKGNLVFDNEHQSDTN